MSLYGITEVCAERLVGILPKGLRPAAKKLLNPEVISYILFGMFTTVISIGSYTAIIYIMCGKDEPSYFAVNTANIISWILAVAFAYITNKIWVFKSETADFKTLIKEISAFLAARLLSLGFELVWMNVTAYLAADHYTKLVSSFCKIIAQFVIVVMNYIFSKLFIFKKEKQ